MKMLSIGVAALGLLAVTAFGQANITIIRERAKGVANQNNARQGAPPRATPARTPAQQTAAPNPQVSAAQQTFARLQADLAAIKTNSAVTAAQKKQLTADLTAAAQGASKPSQTSIAKLADDLASALTGKDLSPAERTRLAQNVVAMLNSAPISLAQKQAITDDVAKILQGSSVRGAAANVVADLKLAAMEVQSAAK